MYIKSFLYLHFFFSLMKGTAFHIMILLQDLRLKKKNIKNQETPDKIMKGSNAASYYHSMLIQFFLIAARASLIADKSLLLSFANDADDVTVKQPRC